MIPKAQIIAMLVIPVVMKPRLDQYEIACMLSETAPVGTLFSAAKRAYSASGKICDPLAALKLRVPMKMKVAISAIKARAVCRSIMSSSLVLVFLISEDRFSANLTPVHAGRVPVRLNIRSRLVLHPKLRGLFEIRSLLFLGLSCRSSRLLGWMQSQPRLLKMRCRKLLLWLRVDPTSSPLVVGFRMRLNISGGLF